MLRFILIVFVLAVLFLGGSAVLLHHFFGWKGLLAFPFLLLGMLWLAKIIIGHLFKRFALGLFGLKSGVLRGARLEVHSVTPITKPVEIEIETETESDQDDSPNERAVVPVETESDASDKPQAYYVVDLTLTPQGNARDRYWEPGELMLATRKVTQLTDLENNEAGGAESVEIWNGSAFGPDEQGKYPGPQRLKITFGVKPGLDRAWLHYYNEPLGEVVFPERWR
jgi:hypothetical protein